MTNTPNLGLTQYAGTDTMNFLTQYNVDMVKVDASAKTSKAIGSDYIYSYTTPPSYSGSTVTLYAGTNYIPAYGRDANGNVRQDIITLSTNKTLNVSGTLSISLFMNELGAFFQVVDSNFSIVSFVANLPATVGNTARHVYYVVNEHRYYYTEGSTTASWSAVIFCKVATVRYTSNVITYFKPNLQQNLAQKIGKDKLLFTMADVNANTDKEFVPSAVAVKELLATLGVDYIVEKGSGYRKWNSGVLEQWGSVTTGNVDVTTASGVVYFGTYILELPITSLTSVKLTANTSNSALAWIDLASASTTGGAVRIYRGVSGTVNIDIHYYAIGTWK